VGGWVDGWVGGRESGVKDCLQQSKMQEMFCPMAPNKIFQEIKNG
jgi:hypothetical protein